LGITSHQPTTSPADSATQLRISVFDIAQNERPRRFDRRRLQKRQITPLPRDDIEGSMKAFDMVLRYRNNFDRVHRLGNVLIPPLAECPGNNYLGCAPPTTD
jgi:hypothetical protein